MARHLEDCPSCRLEVGRIGRSLELGQALLAAGVVVPPREEGLERILELVRCGDRLASEEERLRRELDDKIVAEFAALFGSHPAHLRATLPETDMAFRAEIARLARLFLGRRAALALLRRLDVEAGAA